MRVEHDRDVSIIRHTALQQGTNQRGLACTDLARQLNKSTTLGDPVHEMCERFAMTLAHKQVTRIGRDGKRFFVQSEKVGIHGSLPGARLTHDSTLIIAGL